jgi:6-hydroxynicotinate 3-monooxygenase
MSKSNLRIAVVGAGLGGSTAAALLQRQGFHVTIYEQAPAFARVGAAIHLGPNLVKVLRVLGLEQEFLKSSVAMQNWVSREWDTGEILLNYDVDGENRFGAHYLQAHRGDFHEAVTGAVDPATVAFNKKLVGYELKDGKPELSFEDGTTATADIVIGADGVNSKLRTILAGAPKPIFMKQVAHRSIFPTELLGQLADQETGLYTKWWGEKGEHRMVNHYFFTPDRKEFFVYTSTPRESWDFEGSSAPADIDSILRAFDGAHPDLVQVIKAMPPERSSMWSQFICEPLESWTHGPIAMLGDAVHPMPPYLGQGAAMAVEDGAMLARCITAFPNDIDHAFRVYEANRIARTAKVQYTARNHDIWLRDFADPDWIFGYDAWGGPLEQAAA